MTEPEISPETGWLKAMGVRLTRTEPDEVIAELEVDERHLQPFGLVHGGVHAGLVETVCSIGAHLSAPPGHNVVGMENHTSFLRPVKTGTLRAVGHPIQKGRRAQLWEANVYDGDGNVVAAGRLRVMSVPKIT
jgi:1,4-dihydroxy-2-naphthoyl-CoA hydrolase